MKSFLKLTLIVLGLTINTFGAATVMKMYKGGDTISFSSNVDNVTVLLKT